MPRNDKEQKPSKNQKELIKKNEGSLWKEAMYTGETGKSSFRRTKQHEELRRNMKDTSFTFKHYALDHGEEEREEVKFKYEVIDKEGIKQ